MIRSRERAVVMGGGIAGLAAASVLADRFADVFVIERDAAATPRPHAPQQPHTHIMGAYGLALMERLFPGIDARLEAAGAPRFDFGQCPFYAGRWAPRGAFGLFSRSFTRALFEHEMRASIATRRNVELVVERKVTRIVLSDDRVTAVVLDDDRVIEADFIVDATGMASKTPQLLAEHGFGTAPRSVVDLHGAALTRLHRPSDKARDWSLFSVRPSGESFRCAAISCVEGGLWRVSVWGFGACKPARGPEAQREFARALPTPEFLELLDEAEPVSPPYYFGNAASRWVHYEALDRMPDGLAVVGDAVFHPNFDHSQGMTFCAMAVEVLTAHLDDGLGARPGSTRAFHQAYAERMAPWWEWNLSNELRVPGVVAQPAPAVEGQRLHEYRRIRQAALHDPTLWKSVLEANQGTYSPRDLLTEAIRAKVERALPNANPNAAPSLMIGSEQ